MRRIVSSSLALICALLPLMASAADQAAPALPDYTKAPFQARGKIADSGVTAHPEMGVLQVFSYVTWNQGEQPNVGAQRVLVGKDADGNLKFATYSRLTDHGIEDYAYVYKDGHWVYEP